MNRRGFLSRLGGTGAAVVAAGVTGIDAPHAQADVFTHNGYRVIWRDWVTPANQNVMVGMWLAKHDTIDQQWASTSTGQCYPTRDWEVVDVSRAEGWPRLSVFSTPEERAAVKQRALDALLAVLA